jgi:hypothetical protein
VKVRFGNIGHRADDRIAELTPTEHPKGGEAWTVAMDGSEVGILRRWERKEVSGTVTPTRGTFRSRVVVNWTVYVGTAHRVCESRAEALRVMRTLHRMSEDKR